MKKCISCGIEKPIGDFYKHSRMADGHLNKCKACCRKHAKRRYHTLAKDPEWIEKERERHREKYQRLSDNWSVDEEARREAQRRWLLKNRVKRTAHQAAQHIEVPEGMHRHHWSYQPQHHKSIIPLTNEDHATVHRFLVYDEKMRMFRTKKGELLNTRSKHIAYLRKVLNKEVASTALSLPF